MIDRVVRVEWHTVKWHTVRAFLVFYIDAVGVIGSYFVQRKDVQYNKGKQHDWQSDNVQSEESIQGGTGNQVVATNPNQQVFTDNGNRTE